MATPKKKTSRARRDQRAAHWKATASTYSTCQQCHQPKLPHRVCANCGFYDGRPVLEVE